MSVHVQYPDVGDPEDGESITLEDLRALENMVNTTPSLRDLVRFLEVDGAVFMRCEDPGLTIMESLHRKVVFGIGDNMLQSGRMADTLAYVIPRYTQRIRERYPWRVLLAHEADAAVDGLASELENL